MAFAFDDLIAHLTLRSGAADTWTGDNLPLDYHRVFGGQILAQTVSAVGLALPGKVLRSFTQLFPREGASALPIDYAVVRHQEGKTFATSGVVASQEGKIISVATVSSHVPETAEDPVQQSPRPVGDPGDAVPTEVPMVPWEVRVLDGVDLSDRRVGPATYGFWQRTPALPAEQAVHQALLAYSTDLTLIGTALRPIPDLSQADTMVRFHSAVTAHTVTYHAPVQLDEWNFVQQAAPVLKSGRAYGRGDVWNEAGDLVASFTQESMVRML